MSQNPEGRRDNFLLSLEMKACTQDNKKFYYILNYNKLEQERALYLHMIFGSFLWARIARKINPKKWDLSISNSMIDIIDYQADLP